MDEQKLKAVGTDALAEAATEVAAGKNPLLSKTFWAGVLMAALPVAFPPAAAFMAAQPALYGLASGGIVIGLRHLTEGGFKWPWS